MVCGGLCVVCAGVGVVGDVGGFGGQSFLMSSVMWWFGGRNFVMSGRAYVDQVVRCCVVCRVVCFD